MSEDFEKSKMSEFEKKYIITRDVEHIMTRWCVSGGLEPPCSKFFRKLADELEATLAEIFKREEDIYRIYPALKKEKPRKTVVVSRHYDAIKDLISKKNAAHEDYSNHFWVTLDRVYGEIGPGRDADYRIDVTRLYHPNGCIKIGRGIRPEAEDKDDQEGGTLEYLVDKCSDAFDERSKTERFAGVVVVDDGLYSGDTMVEVVRLLKMRGLKVPYIVTAVAREKGWESLKEEIKLMGKGRTAIFPGTIYDAEQVRDWVCERDFFYGVPLGGRTAGRLDAETPKAGIKGNDQLVGIPYCLFSTSGLHDCAGLEYGAYTMARKSLELSIRLWEKIGELNNGREFKIADLPRVPYPLNIRPRDSTIVTELRAMLQYVP